MTGVVAWDGVSPLTGARMALVLTGPSNNRKTGPMVQAWLLLRDVSPFEAIRTKADRGICGDCVHRAGEPRTCYVSMFNGPIRIWRLLSSGRYPTVEIDEAARRLAGEHVRITAYGDPAFVPFEVWQGLLQFTAGWVGYTHQWRTCDPRFRTLLMASVETLDEANAAHARGWRTFRARPAGATVRRDEVECPASEEAGHRTTCVNCQLCQGTANPAKSVTILLHGKGAGAGGGQPRDRYTTLRQELADTGYSVQAIARAGDQLRVSLAVRQFYRRRRQALVLRSKRLRRGLYLFWKGAA